MDLHLLRHAEAEVQSPSGRDADRRLTAAGIKRMKAVARAIARLDPGYGAILISPLVRARQTAEPVAEACGFRGTLVVTDALVPSAEPERVLHEISGLGVKTVLLVGHQPHLGRLFGHLLTGRDFEVPMRKASLAAFSVSGDPALDRAELRFYLPGPVLELVSGS